MTEIEYHRRYLRYFHLIKLKIHDIMMVFPHQKWIFFKNELFDDIGYFSKSI